MLINNTAVNKLVLKNKVLLYIYVLNHKST